MPDFKGLFSDPAFYQLTEPEQQQVYQTLASQDPELAQLTPEEHSAFANEMIRLHNPQAPQMQLSAAEIGQLTGAPTDINANLVRDERLLAPPIGQAADMSAQLPGTRAGEIMLQGAGAVASGEADALDFLAAKGMAPETMAAEAGRVAAGVNQMAGQTDPASGLLEKTAVNLPQTLMLMAAMGPGAVGMGGAAATGLGGAMTYGAATGAAGAASEAVYEAGQIYNMAKQQGRSAEEAEDLATDAFAKNFTVIALSEIPVNAVTAGVGMRGAKLFQSIINKTGTHVGRRLALELAKTGGEVAGTQVLNAVQEGGQEWLQQGIQQATLDIAGMFDNTEEQQEAAKIGAAIGLVLGVPSMAAGATIGVSDAAERTISGTEEAYREKGKQAALEILAGPEEAAKKGLISLQPEGVPEEGEARHRAAPDYLTPEEATVFVQKGQLNLEEVAARPGVDRTVEQIAKDLDEAEQKVTDLLNPQNMPAQPSQEGDEVVTAIQDGIEQLAVQAEEEGLTELAAARRARKGQVQIVEPRTLWERGLQGVAQLGSRPKLVFYTQPKPEKGEPRHAGVFVRKGLIAVDVTDGNIAPKVILGTMLHEMTHNQEEMTPEAYQGAVDALRGTDLWKRSEADLRSQDVRATVNDKEIMAHIMELEGVATDVMYAIANYTNVQDMAKAPSRVRALAEWAAKVFRNVVGKIGLGKNLEGQPLAVMEKIGMLAGDPEIKRNAARAILALHDMITATPAEGTVQDAVRQTEEAEVAEVAEVAPAPTPAVAEPTAQPASQPQAPERLLAAEIGEEPTTIPLEGGGSLEISKSGKNYTVVRKANSGKVLARKPFPNLKAAKAYINSVAGTKYSVTFQRMRELEGAGSPRSIVSAQDEFNTFLEVRAQLLEERVVAATAGGRQLTAAAVDRMRELAGKDADQWVRDNLEVLERRELSEAQIKFAEFAQGLGITITYYRFPERSGGGFSSTKGQVWINANSGTEASLAQVVAHEITHDLRERHRVAWNALRDHIKTTMPAEWGRAVDKIKTYDVYRNLFASGREEDLENEIVSWVIDAHSAKFWNAVSAFGKERTAKRPFREFHSWLVALMAKVRNAWNSVFGTELYDVLGVKINPKDPVDVAAMEWARALSQLVVEGEGAYSVLDTQGTEDIKTALKDRDTRFKSVASERLVKEVEAPPSGEQIPLFSIRTGYPPAAQTKAQIATWRARLLKLAERGVQGRFWYESSAAAILKMTGGNIEEARKFARLIAVYSPEKLVIDNWHVALTAWERYKAGYTKEEFLREKIGKYDHFHEQAAEILYENAPWGGEKTNSFFSNLIDIVNSGSTDRVTIDRWMMRIFGFEGDSPTDAQYAAMKKETERVAEALGVTPYQAQAMLWVYAKTVWTDIKWDVLEEAARRDISTHVPLVRDGKVVLGEVGKPVMVPTPEYQSLYREMFHKEIKRDLRADPTIHPIREDALANYADGLARKIAVVSMEAIPGSKFGWFKNLPGASLADKVWFTIGVERAFEDEVGDIIGQVMGLYPIGDIGTMLLGNSAYYADGRVQLNPSRQIKYPAAAKRGAEYTFTWDAASKDQVQLATVIRGMLTGQDSVAGYRVFNQPGKVPDRNMAEMDIGAPFSPEQTEEIVRLIDGSKIALYPTDNGMRFLNISDTPNIEFHKAVNAAVRQLSFRGKVSTFMADTFFIERENYADIIQGREQLLREVEDRIADQLAKHYVEAQERGLGDAPAWATERVRKGQALEDAAREYPHFWHFSVEDVTETGIKREFAGTGAAGQERARFKYVDGKIDPESAVVHVYVNTGRAEYMVVTKANFLNKIIAKLRLIPIDTPILKEILDEKGGDLMAMINALRSYGYDGIVDTDRGMAQINRDIDTSEIVEGHELTPDERRAWKGALRLEEIDNEKRYDGLVVPKNVELTQGDVEHVASALTKDGTAWFPLSTDPDMVSQYFGEVRSTSVGLAATKPHVPRFSMRIGESETTPPLGREPVVDDTVEFGTQYSRRSGAGWSLPHMDSWTQFVKWFQDSFIQFKRLHEIMQAHGMVITEGIDVRLAEERYHGMAQEQTRRLENRYIRPILVELRQLAKDTGRDYTALLKDFDNYLHAVHAPERNKYIRYVWYTKKLDDLAAKKRTLEDKIAIEQAALAAATSTTEQDRIKNSIRFYEMKLVKIEQDIDKVKNQPVLNSGMSDSEAAGILSQLRQDGLTKPFGRLANVYVYKMLNERLNNLLREGMITQKEYDAVNQYKHYVPLKGKAVEGDIDDLLNMYTGFTASSGFDVRGSELPFVVGRQADSKINPILAQAVTDVLMTADRIERNRVAVTLLELAESHPNDNLWEINKTVRKRIYDKRSGTVRDVEDWWARNQANVVAAKRGGETFYIYLKDRGMVEAMKGLGVENLWKWVHVLRTAMRTLAQLFTTFSPEFVLTNFTRDWQQALVSATTDMSKEAALEVALESRKAVRGILAANYPNAFGFLKNDYTDAYHELKQEGGTIGFFGMRGVEDMQKAILQEMKSGALVTTMRGARRVGEWVASLNESTENGIRLATYVAAKKHGASKAKAASLAKNVTVNFNRRGDIGGAIGVGWLFFNAGVQGIDRFWKSMQTPAGKKLAAFYIGLGFMTSMLARAAMGDDDDGEDRYDKISDFTKMRHWIIPNFATEREDDYFTVPLPYGFGVMAQIGKELEHMLFSGQDRSEAASEAAVRMLSGFTTHFSPLGETSFNQGWYAMSRPVIPTLIEPITDVLANETYWGGKIYPAKTSWDRRSRSARHYAPQTLTEKLFVGATEKLNHLTGGSEYRSGALDIGPDSLSYLLDSYIGPTGQFIKRPFDLAMKMKTGEDTLWNDWIILRRFVSETAPQYYVPGEYYDAVDDVARAVDERDYLKKNGDAEDMKRFMDRHGWKLPLEKQARATSKTLKELRNRKDADSPEVRKRALEVQRGFVKRYLQSEKP